jgi:glycosyltransferase involved in cell wall biosynthesis
MTIAFDVSYVQKRRVGLGRYATELLKALLSQDAQNEYKLHGWSYSIDKDWLLGLPMMNAKVYVTRIPGFIKRWYWNQLHFPPLETLIGEFDIFQSIDPFLPPTRGKKTVVAVHDLAYRKFPQFFEPSIVRWDHYVVQSIRRASAIIAPSVQTKSDLVEFFQISPERITVVRPPVNSVFRAEPQPALDDSVRRRYVLKHPFILFVGTLEPRKNVAALIRAFEILCAQRERHLELVIVGKLGWLYQGILTAMTHSPVRESIRYLKYVSDDELSALYRSAEFSVYPSFYEGHGSPVIEAMASGKAVITSNSSSLREIGEGAAILVNPTSIEELVEAMRILLEDENRRARLSRLGLQRAGDFSGSAAANGLLALYQSLTRN